MPNMNVNAYPSETSVSLSTPHTLTITNIGSYPITYTYDVAVTDASAVTLKPGQTSDDARSCNILHLISSGGTQPVQISSSPLASFLSPVAGRVNPWDMLAIDQFTNTSNWSFNVLPTGVVDTAWTVSGGVITSPTAGATGTDHGAFFNGVNLSDGRVQAIVENMSTSITYTGVFTRANSTSDVLMAVVHGKGAYANQVVLWRAGGTTTLLTSASLTTTDVTVTATATPFSIELEVLGNIINVYVNGRKLINSYSDATTANYMYGQCGICISSDSQSSFSNFSIRRRKFNVVSPSIKTLLCIGSSITYGVGTTGGGGSSTSWGTRFQTLLNQNFALAPIAYVNGGVNGNKTSDMLLRLPGLLSSNNPDVVVIEDSINDLKDSQFISYAATIANLRQMIKLVKGTGAVPLVTTATPVSTTLIAAPDWSATTWTRNHQMCVRVRNLCAQEDVILIDNFDSFSNDTTLLSDGAHPTDTGAQRMASCALNAVKGSFALY